MTFRMVRAIGLKLPGVEESTMYGMPALKLGGRMLACIASHKSAEPDTLVVCTDFDQRDMLIEEEPAIYYLKEHYQAYPVVLVRLSRVNAEAMRDLLRAAHGLVSASQRKEPRPRARPHSRRAPK